MPSLSRFAEQAVLFEQAYAQAPNTPRSFPSFLTSRFPSQIKWHRQFARFSPISDENLTFFEVLKERGLHTAGIFSHFYMTREQGVAQGFDEWDNAGALTLHDSNTDISAPRITERVVKKLRELAGRKQRFALWTHLFDPHSRYMDHPELPVKGGGFQALEARYDGEVAFTDRHLERIFTTLKESGLDGNTTVILFADHGESFGEHRCGGQAMYFHGETLYDEVLRVPLLVRVPGAAPRRIRERVMLVDIGPTLCELFGAPVPAPFRGRSLAAALAGAPLRDGAVYAELLPDPSWNHAARVFIEGDHKLLYKISENALEMYDLKHDPGEQHNLANQRPVEAGALKQALQQLMAGIKRG